MLHPPAPTRSARHAAPLVLALGIGLLTRGTIDREPRRVRKAAKTLTKANKKVARAAERAA